MKRKSKSKSQLRAEKLERQLDEYVDANVGLNEKIAKLEVDLAGMKVTQQMLAERLERVTKERNDLRVAARLTRSSGYDVQVVASRLETVNALQLQIEKILGELNAFRLSPAMQNALADMGEKEEL